MENITQQCSKMDVSGKLQLSTKKVIVFKELVYQRNVVS